MQECMHLCMCVCVCVCVLLCVCLRVREREREKGGGGGGSEWAKARGGCGKAVRFGLFMCHMYCAGMILLPIPLRRYGCVNTEGQRASFNPLPDSVVTAKQRSKLYDQPSLPHTEIR